MVYAVCAAVVCAAVVCAAACNEVEQIDLPEPPKVIAYMPAPGQFINDGFTCHTESEAIAWAQSRLDAGLYISLGTFGGYLTIDAGRDIENRPGPDFEITGNAFEGNSEPGIVWVSTDAATWYQLQGSDTEFPAYAVTYHQTADAAPGDIHWTDNKGNTGTINHLPQFHNNSYFPLWVSGEQFTLTGTRLENRLSYNELTGLWQCGPYAEGYVDVSSGPAQFDISAAIDSSGNPVNLPSVRYIKIQSAVIAPSSSPLTGEVSTEITAFSIID